MRSLYWKPAWSEPMAIFMSLYFTIYDHGLRRQSAWRSRIHTPLQKDKTPLRKRVRRSIRFNMKRCKFGLLLMVSAALLSISVAHAGEKFRLTVSGTYEFTDASGQIVTTPLTSATMIQDCVGYTNN